MRDATPRLAAELLGTAFLLAVVVGSGIMGQRLGAGNAGIALLANSIATGAGLYVLITALLPWGPHFNPAVTLLCLWRREMPALLALACIAAQCAGAVLGVLCAHGMFGEALVQSGGADRSGWPLAFAELVATSGLLAVVMLVPARHIAAAVALYITAAYWFTASTSFANPAVTLARALTATFAGISWNAVPGFIGAQLAGVLVVASLNAALRQLSGAPASSASSR
jgi:glycerol uptake facilitator-like aquaporin